MICTLRIVAVYNGEKYIASCIDSIMNQTYKNYEVILVDDGSKDSSGTICDHYAEKDSRIKVIHQVNRGCSAARNEGLSHAKGEYIGIIDQDDYDLQNITETVSVIVPVYNVSSYLNKCIKSICEQDYPYLEIILVDDGSTDNSGKICDSYTAKDKRVKVIHKQNQGVSLARNAALDVATGKWVCFVDGDDYVMPNYVSYMLALALAYNADIALTTQMFGNFDSNKQAKNDSVKAWTAEDAVEAILCYKVPIGCYCKIFKREIMETTRFMPEVFIGEGFNFNIAAFQKSTKTVAGSLKTYYYRRDNPTSAMTKFSIQKCECGLLALEIIKEKLQIHTERIERAWEFANWRTHSDFYDAFILAKAKNEYPDVYNKCLSVTRKDALVALNVPTSRQNKLRAIVMWLCPPLIPFLLKIREKKSKVIITHR